jgi:hypothetical protein
MMVQIQLANNVIQHVKHAPLNLFHPVLPVLQLNLEL